MKTKLTLEFDNTEEDKRFAKFINLSEKPIPIQDSGYKANIRTIAN